MLTSSKLSVDSILAKFGYVYQQVDGTLPNPPFIFNDLSDPRRMQEADLFCDLKLQFNVSAKIDRIVECIISKVCWLYRKYYIYDLTEDTFFEQVRIISGIMISILFDSILFKFDGSCFKYDPELWKPKLRGLIKDFILGKLSTGQLNYLVEEDAAVYAKIIYESFTDLRYAYKHTFVAVKNLDNFDFNLACTNSETRHYVKCLILSYMKEHPECTCDEVAKIYHVNVKTVYNIKNINQDINKISFEDIREKPRGPEPRFFSTIPANAFDDLINAIVQHTPDHFGLKGSSWTGQMCVQYLKKFHNIEVKRSYLYYIFRKFEVTSKFGRRINPRRDLDEVIDFLRNRFKTICKEAKKNGERIIWGDETHCNQGYHQGSFSPIGMRSNVSHSTSAQHTALSLFIIIGPDGLVEIYKVEGTFDAKFFQKCLQDLHKKYKNDKFVLIVDNSRIHHAKLISNWLNKLGKMHKKYIRLEYLPAYSPDLNPVEFMNNDFKTHLRKQALNTSKDVIRATNDYIHQYSNGDRKIVEARVKQFFKAPSCLYSWKIYEEVFSAG